MSVSEIEISHARRSSETVSSSTTKTTVTATVRAGT